MPDSRLAELEAWVDESIAIARARGYHPTVFIGMRERHKTIPAMEKIVTSGEIQSGFVRLKHLGLAKDWSVEAGILRFAELFGKDARECAAFRLHHIDDIALRAR